MRTWKRRGLWSVAASLLMAGPAMVAQASPDPSSTTTPVAHTGPHVVLPAPAAATILVDADTGRALYESNDHQPLRPGSLTKTLTAMIAADWLPSGAEIPVTDVAFNAYPDKVGMRPGQKWPMAIALHALITASANDAAYALAVDIGGSLAGFVPILTRAADQIGLSDHPTLEDPAGLDLSEGFKGGNLISAWDLAIMGRDMMANPQLAAIAGLRTFDFEGPDHIAYHLLSHNYHFLASYPGAIGVKTGYTVAAGLCAIEEAIRGGRHMLAVVLHSTSPDADADALLDAGFAVPASREGGGPALPTVTQPRPLPPAPPSTTTTIRSIRSASLKAAVERPGPADHTRNALLDTAAIAGAAGLLVVSGLLWRRGIRHRAAAGRYQPTHARPRGDD